MVYFLYIRHLPDKQSKDEDGGIKNVPREKISGRVKKLVRAFGVPSHVFISPYVRTRETAEMMLGELDKYFSCRPLLFIDPLLGRWNKKGLVHISSHRYHPPFEKEKEEFYKRIRFQLERMKKKYGSSSQKQTLWFITHGVIVSYISRLHSSHSVSCKKVPFLGHYPIHVQ